MKTAKFITNILTAIVYVCIIGFLAIAAPMVLGYHPVVVLSGSMEPTYHVGSVIYYKATPFEQINVGDPITFVGAEGGAYIDLIKGSRLVIDDAAHVVCGLHTAAEDNDRMVAQYQGGRYGQKPYDTDIYDDTEEIGYVFECLHRLDVLFGVLIVGVRMIGYQLWGGDCRLLLPES